MTPGDTPEGPKVTLEWDKHERQRARNRINQRNYRRRKSEALKEGEKKKTKSSSQSPATSSLKPSDFTLDESDPSSSNSEAVANHMHYDYPTSAWPFLATNASQSDVLDATVIPSGMFASEGNLAKSWSGSNAGQSRSPHRSPGPQQLDPHGWHTANPFEAPVSDLTGISSHMQSIGWSNSPNVGTHSQSSDSSSSQASKGKTPLHLATEKGQSQLVQVLLLHGADPNLKDIEGRTALHIAAEQGQIDTVANLITAGSDVNAVTVSGHTPLHLAAENNHLEVIDQLLRAGSDPNIQICDF